MVQVLHSPSAGSRSAGAGHLWHLVPDGLRLTLPRATLQGDAPSTRAPVLHCTPEGSCRGPMMAEAQHLSIWPVFRASWCLHHHQEACRDLLVLCSTGCHCWQACMAAVELVLLCLALLHGAVQVDVGKALSVLSTVVKGGWRTLSGSCCGLQADLRFLEATDPSDAGDADEQFYAGGGQFKARGTEHFPQLWCQNGTYSVYGQVGQDPSLLLSLPQRSTALRLQLHLWGQQAIPTSLANVEAVAAKHKLSLGCEATTDRVPSTAAGQPAVLL